MVFPYRLIAICGAWRNLMKAIVCTKYGPPEVLHNDLSMIEMQVAFAIINGFIDNKDVTEEVLAVLQNALSFYESTDDQ
jgi:hypothetical protein